MVDCFLYRVNNKIAASLHSKEKAGWEWQQDISSWVTMLPSATSGMTAFTFHLRDFSDNYAQPSNVNSESASVKL